MFEKFFKKYTEDLDDFDEYEEPAKDIVDIRRKERFNTPLIDADDFEEVSIKPEKIEKQEPPKTTQIDHLKSFSSYKPKRIISPFDGVNEESIDKTLTSNKSKTLKKVKPKSSLVTVISPFYGSYDEELDEQENEEDAILQNIIEKKETKNEKLDKEKLPTVEENLRNIANIVNEEKDQLRIIEERTGEFKLSFDDTNIDNQSLIDEIDDNMSLDELMSLYEKKFRD